MTVAVRPLKTQDNAAIADAIRNGQSLQYQQRIPAATDAGIRSTIENLQDNPQHFNEFIDALVNRIGLVLAKNISWTNPLAQFKRGMLRHGDTIEEYQVGLVKAKVYDPDREYMERDLFGTERPPVKTFFHHINRQDWYKVSVNQTLLARAFLEDGGLSRFVGDLIQSPMTSDQWDEFLLTTQLFKEYEANGGFYHVNVPAVSAMNSNAADAKAALRKMRALTKTLGFLSSDYNAAKMPTFARPDDLVLFATPEFIAAVDVEALSAAFNIDKLEASQRMIPIPRSQLGIKGAEAIMTTRDFFVIADTHFSMQQQPNPVALQTNYFLHHHQIISTSLFAPAVLFGDVADDERIEITGSVTSVATPTIEPVEGDAVTDVARGGMVAFTTDVVDDPDGSAGNVSWSITSGVTSQRTYITQYGVLHVGTDETASSVTVRATSTFIDPENPRLDAKYAETTISLTGTAARGWPVQSGGIESITIAGVDVPNVAPGTTTYTLALDAGTTVAKRDVQVGTDGSANVEVSTAKSANGYTVTISVDPGTGAAVDYTVNVTVG